MCPTGKIPYPSPQHDVDWRPRAACIGDWNRFFSDHLHSQAQAIHICTRHCPVLAPCARDAAKHPPFGAVQAGVRYATHLVAQHQPADPGCGPWCWPSRERT